jgi:hypothetical protein
VWDEFLEWASRTYPKEGELSRQEAIEYEILQLRMRIVQATHEIPPPGCDDHLRSPDYLPPPGSEWPPKIRLVADKGRG